MSEIKGIEKPVSEIKSTSKIESKITNTHININIISLKRAKERRKFVEKFVSENPECKIFEAIDKEKLKRYFKPKSKRYLGELGCFLSHVYIIKKFLESDMKYQIILEDDIDIKKKLPKSVKDIEEMIKEIKVDIEDIDILYLHKRVHINEYYEIIGGHGTEGYILTRKGAKKLFIILGNNFKYPVDHQIEAHIKNIDSNLKKFRNKRAYNIIINGYRSKDIYVSCKNINSIIG